MGRQALTSVAMQPLTAALTIATAIVTTAVFLPIPAAADDKSANAPSAGFVIRVVDAATERPVPLVELTTTHSVRYITDNAGVVLVSTPELMGRQAFFTVTSHGYEYPRDGFGNRGVRLLVTAGNEATVKLERRNLAERLYRITGAGRYHHSRKAGLPIAEGVRAPRPDGGVFGCDSVQVAEFQGRLFWIWGDTNRARYPLGNFQASAATSPLPRTPGSPKGFDPEVDIPLRYFVQEDHGEDEVFVKGIAPMTGEGPTWLTGLTTLNDTDGAERLVCSYMKVKPPMNLYRRGLCEFDSSAEAFRHVADLVMSKGTLYPEGHSFEYQDADGRDWIYYADPLPTMRHPASYEAWRDTAQYQAITADAEFSDAISGRKVTPHRGSISWNEHRQHWVMIFCETGGERSHLGEIWYAEATAPEGPWRKCVQVVTHDDYSFYNPCQHPVFATDGGRVIYFEGTYTAMFSTAPVRTPRYNYNQILYRLDLDDPRLQAAQTDGVE